MPVSSRSIPLKSAEKIFVQATNRSACHALHWFELLGCTVSAEPVPGGIVITSGEPDASENYSDVSCVIRLWDYQVGMAGSGVLASAASGAAAVIGHPGEPGVALPVEMPEKWCAAYGVIIALAELWRVVAGENQKQVEYDVSAADVLRAFSLQNSGDEAERTRTWRRNGRVCVEHGGIFPMGFFACRDGYVALLGRSRRDWRHIRKALGDPAWAQEPRFEDPFTLAKDSAEADALLEDTLSAFDRDELLRRGLSEGAVIAPVYSAEEAHERDIFRDNFIANGTPAMPFIVESLSDGAGKEQRGKSASVNDAGPLAGLRCLELCWVWSGPMVGQILADLGAEVIKVETPKRFDLYRTRGLEAKRGQMDERTRIESSIYFHSLNRNKTGLSLDLKQDEGFAIAKSLVGISDLLIENFTVGTMERLGLSKEMLADANARLVQLSMSGPGRGSAVENLRSYGLVLSALGGAESLIEENGAFIGSPTFSISDPNAAVFGAMAAIAGALSARETGKGLAVDLSQIEAAATISSAPVRQSLTVDAIVKSSEGIFVAACVPGAAVADEAALRRSLDDTSFDSIVNYCTDVGGYAAVMQELDETDTAAEFSDCSAWIPSKHPYTGDEKLVAAPWRADGQRSPAIKPAPLLGEGDDYVLRDLLSFGETEIAALNASGVVGVPDFGQPGGQKRKKVNS
jgi:crotonobetainyl-CoA:carnitine CoA-transferase CaiB-like acyl-CoA transferase